MWLVLAVAALNLTRCRAPQLPAACRRGVSLGSRALFVVLGPATSAPGRADVYDAATRAWSSTAMRSPSRTNPCVTSWRHKAIIAGGSTGRGQPKSRLVDVWDSEAQTWSVEQLSIGRDLLGCASVGNLTLFVGGSAPQANQSETDVVDIWDHATGAWSTARLSQPRKKPEAVVAGGKVVVAGGEIAKPRLLQGYSDVVDVFTPGAGGGSWSATSLPSPPRQYFGAAGVGDVAVFGGGFYNDERLGDLDLYHAREGTWTKGPPLSTNRSNLAACAVGGRYAAFGPGNISPEAKLRYDVVDTATGATAQVNASSPGLRSVVGVGGVALFVGCDGSVDAISIDAPCADRVDAAVDREAAEIQIV